MNLATPKIDPEFEGMLGHLHPDEFAQLKTNIEEDGQLDKGIVWQETGILLEGHNRMRACQELGIPFKYNVMSFATRQEAGDWIWRQQLGRRNLAKMERDLLIARRVKYLRAQKEKDEKARQESEPDGEMAQNEPSSDTASNSSVPGTGNVVAQVAHEVGVSPATVKRAVAAVEESAFCERCTRVGPVKDCPRCAEKQAARPKKKGGKGGKKNDKPPAKGSELVDWKGVEKAFGVVVRLSDDIARAYPAEKKASERGEYERLVGVLVRKKDAWKKKVTG